VTLYAHWKNALAKVTNCKYLNIRKARSAKSGIVKTVGNGADLEILNKEGKWYRVKSGKIKGYALSKYLKL
jgi:uncharacterized protein YgiM (DUF1202 family)